MCEFYGNSDWVRAKAAPRGGTSNDPRPSAKPPTRLVASPILMATDRWLLNPRFTTFSFMRDSDCVLTHLRAGEPLRHFAGPWRAAIVLVSTVLGAMPGAQAGEPIKVAMTADRWTTTGIVAFAPHKGADSIQLLAGDAAQHIPTGKAVLNDFVFRSGTIEFDVDPTGSMGAGLGFRRRDNDNYEDFYLRPQPRCDQAFDCMQYAPQTHGILLWDLFPRYQAPAALKDGDWNHIKFVVSGRQMNIFINGAASPTLHVGRLEGDTAEGGILLTGPGFFANLTITPNAVADLASSPERDALANDPRYVRNWQLSNYSTLGANESPSIADLPPPSAEWKPLTAERAGLVNISRLYGLPLARPQRAVAWLKTTIHANQTQTRKVDFGWVREAWVFVNGKLVYADRNMYLDVAARKEPDGRCALQNGSFLLPLKTGDNEVAIAVANNFYGWGILFRVDDVKGIEVRPVKG